MSDTNEKEKLAAIRKYHDLRNPLAAGLFREKPEITVKEPTEKVEATSASPDKQEAFASNPFMRGFQENTALSEYFKDKDGDGDDDGKKKKAPPWLKDKKSKKDDDSDKDDKDSDSDKDSDKDDDGDKDGKDKKKDKKGKVVINIKENEELNEVRDHMGDVWKHVKDVVRGHNHPLHVDYGKEKPYPAAMHVWHNTRTHEVHEGDMHVGGDGVCRLCHHSEPHPRTFHISHYVKAASEGFKKPGVV